MTIRGLNKKEFMDFLDLLEYQSDVEYRLNSLIELIDGANPVDNFNEGHWSLINKLALQDAYHPLCIEVFKSFFENKSNIKGMDKILSFSGFIDSVSKFLRYDFYSSKNNIHFLHYIINTLNSDKYRENLNTPESSFSYFCFLIFNQICKITKSGNNSQNETLYFYLQDPIVKSFFMKIFKLNETEFYESFLLNNVFYVKENIGHF